jgi:Alkaline phosphatase PhoX
VTTRGLRWATVALAGFALALSTVEAAGGATGNAGNAGFFTSRPPQLVPLRSGVTIEPLLSAGDVVDGYQATGVMDGLGVYRSSNTTVELFMNHELEGSDPTWARVSHLTLSNGAGILSGHYSITGTEGFEDFCSSTLAMIEGHPWYFLGEETLTAGKGRALAIDATTDQRYELPWLGRFEHENVVPMTSLANQGVFLELTEDEEAGLSQHYLYRAPTMADLLAGRGQLFVWVPDQTLDGDPSPNDITKGQTIPGTFKPIPGAATADYDTLEDYAQSVGAFDFVRPEDATEIPGQPGVFYMADTGTKNSEDFDGRIYRFAHNMSNPLKASLRVVLDSTVDNLRNPDNLGASTLGVMIQEDRNGDNIKAKPPGQDNLGGYGRVGFYSFATGTLTWYARVNTPDRDAQRSGEGSWESSGVIDTSKIFGPGTWLLDVQAHTQSTPQPGFDLVPSSSSGEDAQLILMTVPGTTA